MSLLIPRMRLGIDAAWRAHVSVLDSIAPKENGDVFVIFAFDSR